MFILKKMRDKIWSRMNWFSSGELDSRTISWRKVFYFWSSVFTPSNLWKNDGFWLPEWMRMSMFWPLRDHWEGSWIEKVGERVSELFQTLSEKPKFEAKRVGALKQGGTSRRPVKVMMRKFLESIYWPIDLTTLRWYKVSYTKLYSDILTKNLINQLEGVGIQWF